ncbi:hypothetical protein [Methylorubrum suomiense]|uniref:Uncharacterized protein n=1 Tax=Methylorubrum suomiense TaxID=144191 RepID=A0ABQ4UX37_9HYPH|nr:MULTISPECIES: hypothetical protein [Methylobacteriaceae]GJE76360.1 hypothetical protein BGCPKDLD_2952 [Methylorubrum suomiense]
MLRPGFVLGVTGPAAILTLLTLPLVRYGADAMAAPAPAPRIALEAPVASPLPGLRPYNTAISPIHVATAPRPVHQLQPVAPTRAVEEIPVKPRRLTREGCETPISSLAGPEARRMVPGRCMA